MQQAYQKHKVDKNIEVSKGIFKLVVEGSYSANPGQFYMLRTGGGYPLLSRPISVHDIDGFGITFLYEVKGEGTKILSNLRCGDDLELMGPLGNGFDIQGISGKVAIVSGGVGIAPMYYVAKMIKNAKVDLYAGFRDDIYLVDDFEKLVSSVYKSTESGRYGHKGYITEIFSPVAYSQVLCCGPEAMMEKVINKCIEFDTQVFVSMERRMACGVGACLVCTCKTRFNNKRVCADGPVFSGREVMIDA